MQIVPLNKNHLSAAAALFTTHYQRQRLATPCLPETILESDRLENLLTSLLPDDCAFAAIEGDQLLGYLGGFVVGNFRGAGRTGAYVPEWAHACAPDAPATLYTALYRTAGEAWSAAGCQVHAITLLAYDQVALHTWFWHGFGMLVVDAIRPMQSLEPRPQTHLSIRRAAPVDAEALAQLDAEHWMHYTHSPIFMPPRPAATPAEIIEFISRPANRIYLAEDHGNIAGYMRFDGYDFDGVAILDSEAGIFTSGAYIRPAYRGQGGAAAMLDAALRDYQAPDCRYCTVNFETFNPQAAAMWPRFFTPVCYSLNRLPEMP